MLAAAQPYPQYFDLDGSPLDGGAIYYGEPNQDPQSAPLTVYWDAAGTQPAAQPIATLNGFPVRSGTPAAVYVSGDYSLRVRNKQAAQVLHVQSAADASQSLSTQLDLASTAAGKGSKLVAFLQRFTGAVARWVEDKLAERVSVLDFGADPTGATDSTAAFSAAMNAAKHIRVPAGTYLLNLSLAGKRGYWLDGDGRDCTTLKNYGNAPVFTLDATNADCKFNRFTGFRIQNRDKTVYTSADGFYVNGIGTLENDFHEFRSLEIVGMRHGFNYANRAIWHTFSDVHVYSCIQNGFHFDTTDNISQLRFAQVRSGQNGGHGMYVKKDAGDPLAGWGFLNVTLEKNELNGLRVSGAASGISGWSMAALYFEENTRSVAAGSTAPRKANVFIDAALCLGLDIGGGTIYGTPLSTPLDWGIYIASTTASGRIGPCRSGTFAQGFASVPGGFEVGPRDGGTNAVVAAGNSIDFAAAVSETQDSFALTLTGCTTSPTGTATAVKQRGQVSVTLPPISGVSNSTAATLTGLPAGFRPASTQTVLLRVTNDGATTVGMAQISPAGAITLYPDMGGGGFAASGTKGVAGTTITYNMQ